MRRLTVLLALAALTPALPARADLKVVATVEDLGALSRAVLGSDEAVTVLARPTQDPHFVDARPNLMLSLNKADALVLVGAELEIGWLPVLLKGARNERIINGAPGYIDASTMVPMKGVPSVKVERSMGDIHPSGNPHYTIDPDNGVRIVQGLADRFSQLDPEGAARYKANATKFISQALPRIAHWKEELAGWSGNNVVTYHASWIYFTDFASLHVLGTIEPKPGIPPNAQHVAALIGRMKAEKVPVILQESWYGSATSEVVARNTGARLVVVSGMAKAGQSYLDHIDEVVTAVVKGLKGS